LGGDGVLLGVDSIHAGYGKMEILHGISLAVRPRELVSLIGPNGAGKSTVFKTVVGFLRPTSGRVLFAGRFCQFSRHLHFRWHTMYTRTSERRTSP
jgi:ABC-type branched-subunit amino acid transport system ATPase component